MKYYLETNALRALGSNLGKNPKLLSESYTSLFSLFELAKGIERKKDSEKRFKILSSIAKLNMKLIDLMPIEMMQTSFVEEISIHQSAAVIEKINSFFTEQNRDTTSFYENLVEDYEQSTLKFQHNIAQTYLKPKPKSEIIELSLDTLFAEPKEDIPPTIKNLPKGSHPSRIVMEIQKTDVIPSIYKGLFGNSKIDDKEIQSIYNDQLDLFIFSEYSYMLKKRCLRELASKNDLLDILHSVYLFNHDKIMVSDDKIFNSILPNINIISINDYKKLI